MYRTGKSGETLAENSAPAAVISSSKNLLESLLRIVLDRSQIDYAAREDIPQLYRKTRTWPPAPPPAIRQLGTSPRPAVRVVADPHRLQMLAGLGHPHQHRPAPMQIHPHDLLTLVASFTGASFVVEREHLEHALGTHEERRPRSFITSEGTFLISTPEPPSIDR